MKIKYIIFLIVISLLLCSCSNNNNTNNQEIESSGYHDVNNDINCNYIKDAIYYLDNSFFINSNGQVYKFKKNKLYSNEKNCIETDFIAKNFKFAIDKWLYNNNNELIAVYDVEKDNILIPNELNNHPLLYINTNFDFITSYECEYNIYLYIKDKKIYKYNDSVNDLYLGKIPDNENIIYMAGDIIKTDKNIYQLKKTNSEECSKYVDVDCTFAYEKSNLSNIYNDIILISQKTLIDKNFKHYSKGYCYTFD